jgi:hypothetical protein
MGEDIDFLTLTFDPEECVDGGFMVKIGATRCPFTVLFDCKSSKIVENDIDPTAEEVYQHELKMTQSERIAAIAEGVNKETCSKSSLAFSLATGRYLYVYFTMQKIESRLNNKNVLMLGKEGTERFLGIFKDFYLFSRASLQDSHA